MPANALRRKLSMAEVPQADLATPTAVEARRKPHREELPPDANLCDYCAAKCCRYFALPIEEPTTWKDFEYIRWYLLHDRAAVFVEDDSWYLLVHTRCRHLRDDNLCSSYESRPPICREYSMAKCEYEDDWVYDHYFETAEQVEEYAEAVLPLRRGRSIRSPKPEPLRVLP
jgi:Fe-S-cluster containining protein